jgi:MarR family transcriptional regulator, organic hydroperoxide resistance regulator
MESRETTSPRVVSDPAQGAGRDTGVGLADAARLLTVVERRISGRLAVVLETADSTVEQWRVLSLLADGRGHAMTEVAEHAVLPAPTLTKVVDRMVAANLVYRRADESDRRRVLALLTPRGRAAHRAVARAVAREEADLAALMGADEAGRLGELLACVERRLR